MILLMKGEVIAVRKWKEDFIPLIKTKLTNEVFLGNEDSLKFDLKVNDIVEGLFFSDNPSIFVVTNIVNYEKTNGEGSSTFSLTDKNFEFCCKYNKFTNLNLTDLTPNKVTEIIRQEKFLIDDVEEIGVLRDKDTNTLYQAFLIKNIIRLIKMPNNKILAEAN